MHYYNPKIFTPKAKLYDIALVPEHKYEMYSRITKEPFAPYLDKTSALDSRWTGTCRFWDDGKMYEACHIAENAYIPVTPGEVAHHFGINWDTFYADNKDNLINHIKERYVTIFGADPTYDETHGLWSIQVHYDGRCR